MSSETVDVVIDSLVAAGVRHIFGVPGAKIDSVFNALIDRPRSSWLFAATSRMPPSSPERSAVSQADPACASLPPARELATLVHVVAIVGDVKRVQAAKKTHQSLRVQLLEPVTKKTTGANRDRMPQGATAISLPIDIMTVGTKTSIPALPPSAFTPPQYGTSPSASLSRAAAMIQNAKFPVLFLGSRAATPDAVEAVHGFLRKHPIPVVETFQAAGSISQELAHLFYGRIGLFRNQPGDKLLSQADLVIVAGYDQSEYDADAWHKSQSLEILHLDWIPADYGAFYNPKLELVGAIAANVKALGDILANVSRPQESEIAKSIFTEFHAWEQSPQALGQTGDGPVHPLYFIKLIQGLLPASTTYQAHSGSIARVDDFGIGRRQHVHLALAVLLRIQPQVFPRLQRSANSRRGSPMGHRRLSSPGAALLQEGRKHQWRRRLPLQRAGASDCREAGYITHFIWNDGKYNMVEFQEVDKYGRSSGVDLGGVDFVKYAEAFGAKGLRVNRSSELEAVMKEALSYQGVCIVDVEIDYSHNHELMKNVIQDNIS
ncbi:acetolactate synthase [Colletotrichum scovillei]|uniref:acetolactate synthase n=1 Tax=Colletotrichum scovillei TaxID=1209932 RepID=UPI0015C2D1C8|nr:acetolactate synthase [Colletotrichum scovillei]KAF4782760.1 acetolactate synthase [Colletotrichum scovillei]